MGRKARYSIRNRILLTILFTSIAVVVFLTWVLFYQNRTQKQDLVERSRAIAQFIGSEAIPALQSGEKDSLEKAVRRIRGYMGITTIYIFDAAGDLFLSDPKQSSSNAPNGWMSPRADFTGDALHFVAPIIIEDQVLGSVYLQVPTRDLSDRMRKYSFIFISYMILVLSISAILAFQIRKTISLPLNQLLKTIRDVPESVGFRVEPTRRKSDEITDLYSGFNKMLRKIERREVQKGQVETALQESERRYRNLVESSPDAIFLQQNDRIIYMNAAGLNLFGISSIEKIIGKDIYSFLVARQRKPSRNFETKLIRLDGKLREVDVTFVEITHDQAPAIQGIIRDVTERKHLRETAERMKRLAAIGELSAHIAHEIRNSIASLQLNLENLSKHTQKESCDEKIIHNMQTGIQRMGETVTTILNFARPNPPTMKRISVRVVLESALKSAEKELQDFNIRVACNFNEQCPDIFMDPNQVHQAFLNLLRNSREAMPSGGTISIETRMADDFVEVELCDTGEGISEKDLDRIFDPFFTTRRQGTGLGLAFVARTMEQHRASVFIESTQKTGTRVFIRFPLNPS